MVDTIQSAEQIPKTLLDEFSSDLWFRASHTYTYLRPRCVNPTTFKLRPQVFGLTEEALHREVESWLGVVYEITEGKLRYLFRAMVPHSQEGEGAESSRRAATEALQPMLLQIEETIFEVRRTIASFNPGEGEYLEHFQGSTMLFPIIMPPLSMAPP